MQGSRPTESSSARKTSKYDVEVANARVALERTRNRGLAMRSVATGFAWALGIAAFGLAILLSKGVVHEIAGRKTVFEADFVLKGGLTISLAVNVAAFVHARVRKRTIKRLRERLTRLETSVVDLEIDAELE
jgi:hypothetical protein